VSDAMEVSLMGMEGEVVQQWYVWRNDTSGVVSPIVYGGCRIAQTNTATLRIDFAAPATWTCGEGQVQPTPPTERRESVAQQ